MQVMFFQAACYADSEQFDVTVPAGMTTVETFRTTGAVSYGALCSAMLRVQDFEQVCVRGNAHRPPRSFARV